MSKRRGPSIKDVNLLSQLSKMGQLELAPVYQRNSVWPRAAKAYLIDTILEDKPIPLLFFRRGVDSQTGRNMYWVVDGQQRLRAIFDFLEDRFRLSQSTGKPYHNKRFSTLKEDERNRIRNYELAVEELHGYDDPDVKDIFIRMNKYLVKLSPQELRHARESGAFHAFVERLGRIDFWQECKIFTALQIRRMKPIEFSAELAILLIEGPQDKKEAVDLYYEKYKTKFSEGATVRTRLNNFVGWIKTALPELKTSRFRKPVDFYALIGALSELESNEKPVPAKAAGERLRAFEQELSADEPPSRASKYLIAASRQTDNLKPRLTRIQILLEIISG